MIVLRFHADITRGVQSAKFGLKAPSCGLLLCNEVTIGKLQQTLTALVT